MFHSLAVIPPVYHECDLSDMRGGYVKLEIPPKREIKGQRFGNPHHSTNDFIFDCFVSGKIRSSDEPACVCVCVCMCVEKGAMYHFKFHTKYLHHSLTGAYSLLRWVFRRSEVDELMSKYFGSGFPLSDQCNYRHNRYTRNIHQDNSPFLKPSYTLMYIYQHFFESFWAPIII